MSSRTVQIVGGPQREFAHVDGPINALQVTDVSRDPVTEGWVFSAGVFVEVLSQLATITLLIRNSTGTPTLGSVISVGVDFEAELFEAPTVTVAGTPVTKTQVNRSLTLATAVTVFSDPTTTADGIALGRLLIPKDSLTVAGGQIIMKASTDYMLRLTNIGVADSAISLAVSILDVDAA